MSKWSEIENRLYFKGLGALAYKRSTGAPYIRYIADGPSRSRKDEQGEFSVATRQDNQTSLYLAFYPGDEEAQDEKTELMISRTVSLPSGLPAGTEVKIEAVIHAAPKVFLSVSVSIPGNDIKDCYVADANTKGMLLLSQSNHGLLPEYEEEARRQAQKENPKERVEAVMKKCWESIIGMSDIKRELQSLLQVMLMQEELEKNGQYMEKCNWHFLIGGASGSGKTMLSEAIRNMLYGLHITVENVPQVVNAVQLLANPELLTNLLKKGMSRTIIIENFEKLCPATENTGQPAPDNDEFWILLYQCMEKAKEEELCHFIFAGETEAMKRLLEKRPKLLAYTTGLFIPEYTEEELFAMGGMLMRSAGFIPADEAAKEQFHKRIRELMVQPDFANAYSLKYLIGEAQKSKGNRYDGGETVMKLSKEDFMKEEEKEETLEELLEELDSLTGLESVKNQIHQRLNVLKMEKLRMDRGLLNKKSSSTLHMVFHGNAGTGKTTVARMVGRIYGKAGLIKNGNNFVEASRESLVAGYQGQSAIKAMECIERAIGGVLFIDEAYNLVNGEHDTFGMEVLNTLLAPIENNRENLMVIMAGYKEEMEELFRQNQGLASRMHTIIEFEDYSRQELGAIFYQMAAAEGYLVREEDKEAVTDYLWEKRAANAMEFANARGVRNCFEDAKLNQATRLTEMEKNGELSDEALMTLLLEDICSDNEE